MKAMPKAQKTITGRQPKRSTIAPSRTIEGNRDQRTGR